MIRRALLLTGLVLFLAVASNLRAPRVTEAALSGNCGDPAHANAVSIWSYNASNSTSGQFTMIQSKLVGDFLAGVSMHNLLGAGKDWSGILIKLGTTVFVIANFGPTADQSTAPASEPGFIFAIIDLNANSFTAFEIGAAFALFALINVTSLDACYNNLAPNPGFEPISGDDPSSALARPDGWTCNIFPFVACNPSSGGADWFVSRPPTINEDRHTGSSAVRTRTAISSCGPDLFSEAVWVSTDIPVTPGRTYSAGAFTRSLDGTSKAVIELLGATGSPVVTRTSTLWGLATGSITIPSPSLIFSVNIRLSAERTSCSAGTDAKVNFDDVFLVDTTGGPAP